eukprot:scaffold28872_cov55-Phaeocystis_antarctica.AAC.6
MRPLKHVFRPLVPSQTSKLAGTVAGTAHAGARGASSPAALCCTAAAMVYGGASHLDASDVEREKRARQGALAHQVERERSARVGAPTREEVDAWQLLQQDNRSDHIGPRVPEGRLPLPAPDSSSDCRLCHQTTTSTPRHTGTLCLSTLARLQIAPSSWPKASCAATRLRTTRCAGPSLGSRSSSYQACTWRCATRHAHGSLQRRPVKQALSTACQFSPVVRLVPGEEAGALGWAARRSVSPGQGDDR